MNATVPDEMMDVVDACVLGHTALGALYLGVSSVSAAVLGAILSTKLIARPSTKLIARPSTKLIARPSTNVSAHYELDTHKLVLRFNRPVIAQNPQRMILLYSHTDGMATVVLGQQCGDGGLTLSFITNVKESPTHMELIVCSGAMHPAGSPELDVCADGRPVHLDVDILHCDT